MKYHNVIRRSLSPESAIFDNLNIPAHAQYLSLLKQASGSQAKISVTKHSL